MNVRCPANSRFKGDIVGCGHVFYVQQSVIDDDPDGWADCPKCGLGFDAEENEIEVATHG